MRKAVGDELKECINENIFRKIDKYRAENGVLSDSDFRAKVNELYTADNPGDSSGGELIDRNAFSALRAGRQRFRIEQLIYIADVIGCSLDDLTGRAARAGSSKEKRSPRDYCKMILEFTETLDTTIEPPLNNNLVSEGLFFIPCADFMDLIFDENNKIIGEQSAVIFAENCISDFLISLKKLHAAKKEGLLDSDLYNAALAHCLEKVPDNYNR